MARGQRGVVAMAHNTGRFFAFASWLAVSSAAVLWLCSAAGYAQTPATATAAPSAPPTATPAAQSTAAPSAQSTPAPSPSPTIAPGLHLSSDFSTTVVDTATRGPGQVAPEAAGFIAGSPLSPNTPYDLFSSAPIVPGFAGSSVWQATASLGLTHLDFSAVGALALVRGSVTNAAFWGESLPPPINPHLGSTALPYAIVFPTHAGGDDGTAFRASLLAGTVATKDGNLRLRGGWFDLVQTERFVFAPPALTSVNPAIALATAETLGTGLPALDSWSSTAGLPLHGIDLLARRGNASIELTSAALPALSGTGARLTMGSLVVDRGQGTRFSAQALHVVTGGDPLDTTILFGTNPTLISTPQGMLPASRLGGQRQTIIGARAAFHATHALDATIELGRAWYDADQVVRPGTSRPGSFVHAGVTRAIGRVTASLDAYRMEPRYATVILPYGVPENQWSASFSWPGQWLKSNYQLVDNTVLGVNRQGYRLRYYVDRGPLEIHAEYVDLRQIEPVTVDSARNVGFVEGYYLPQQVDSATFGRQKRAALWIGWHPGFADVTLDLVEDTLFRPSRPTHPEDAVAYDVPQAVITISKTFGKNAVAAAGLGRYGLHGTFTSPLDFAQRTAFAGIEFRSRKGTTLAQFRRTIADGIQPAGGPSPAFTGSLIILEQRVHF